MKEHINIQIHQLIKVKYPWIKRVPRYRETIIGYLVSIPKLHFNRITWASPPRNKVKVNTDGACKGKPGQSSYVFCNREVSGNMIYEQGHDIGVRTNLDEEIIAMFEALRYCKKVGLKDIIMESDSPSLVIYLTNSCKVPRERTEQMEECKDLMLCTKAMIQHTLREGNNLADFIARHINRIRRSCST